MSPTVFRLCERGWLPDFLARPLFRLQFAALARKFARVPLDERRRAQQRLIDSLSRGPAAPATREIAEPPPEFFGRVLGSRRKFSCNCFIHAGTTLADAEEAMLRLYIERGQFADGQSVLDLDCGWGSLTLRLAELFPTSRIVGLARSDAHRDFVESERQRRGLENVRVALGSIDDLESETFDRVVSIEAWQRVQNLREALTRVARRLKPDGKLLVQLFVHREHAFPLAAEESTRWLTEHFLPGGLTPSDDLLLRFQGPLLLEDHWRVGGEHYKRTCNAWLANLDRERAAVLEALGQTHGGALAATMFRRWRTFFLALSELFGCAGGREWFVSHYLLGKSPRS